MPLLSSIRKTKRTHLFVNVGKIMQSKIQISFKEAQMISDSCSLLLEGKSSLNLIETYLRKIKKEMFLAIDKKNFVMIADSDIDMIHKEITAYHKAYIKKYNAGGKMDISPVDAKSLIDICDLLDKNDAVNEIDKKEAIGLKWILRSRYNQQLPLEVPINLYDKIVQMSSNM